MGWIDSFLATLAKKPQLGEVASDVDDLYHKWNMTPFNPDNLAAKKGGLGIYKKMREDDQIKACLQLKKSSVITPGWEIVGGEDEQREYTEFVFANMDGTLEGFIFSLLSAFDYGFSVHEKIYNYIDTGKFSGKIGLKNLKAKSPTRIDFKTDGFGNLVQNGILQKQDNGVIRHLPIDKFVLYSYQQEFDNFYGESDLKSAYRLWFVKTEVLKYWAIYLERFSVPIITGRTMTGRVTDAQRESFIKLIKSVQAGTSALVPQDLALNLLESTRVDRGVFEQAINALNIGMARAILIPQISLVPQTTVGSYGKSDAEFKVFDWVLGTISKEISEVVNEQIIVPLVDMNYGEQREYPRLAIKPMKEEDKARMVAAWSEAVARGAAVPTLETVKYVRELLGFPEMEEGEEGKITEALKNAQAAPQGSSGLSGGPSKSSNVPGKQNQYTLEELMAFAQTVTLPGPESRVAWEQYVNDLNSIEDDAKKELTTAFKESIFKMIEDAKKNSTLRKG